MRRFWPRIGIKVGERFRKESLMIAIWCNANLKTSNCIYGRSRALPLNQHPSARRRNMNRNCRGLSDGICNFLASRSFRDCHTLVVINAWPNVSANFLISKYCSEPTGSQQFPTFFLKLSSCNFPPATTPHT